MSNDLRHIAQQFVSTSFHCRMLEKKLEERAQAASQERLAVNAAHGVELSSFRRKLQVSQERIARLEQDLRDIESGHGNTDKRRKIELEKKTEKINNQKRRIKEQQDQIEVTCFSLPSLSHEQMLTWNRLQKLKDKYITGPRAVSKLSRANSRVYEDDSSSDLEFPHSATSAIDCRSSPPPMPEPKYTSTLNEEDEEFLINNLKKLHMPCDPMRMDQDPRHIHGGPPPNPYANFGHPMPMAAMGPMSSMSSMSSMSGGSMPPYGGFPLMGAYGPQNPSSYGQGAHYSGPGHQGPTQPVQSRHNGQFRRDHSRSSRASDTQNPSNALILRRHDDSEIDPEVKMWKDMFMRLFSSTHGWAEMHCAQVNPGAVEEATSKNPKLWDYILKVATCHKDRHAAPKHALFMLNSPGHRSHFISRLLLQYIEQEMFSWKFWLGWDDETDVKMNKLGPITEFIGHPLDTRRDARQEIRRLVEEIAKDEDYGRFRHFKQSQHVGRFKDIAGPFINFDTGKDVMIGLHSVANTAMEISMKMMTSRLSFAFTWNECAVKFSHDSHIALNNDMHGLSLQHKHTRVAIVVTPSISYRDDSGRSIVPRGVAKAQVLTMK